MKKFITVIVVIFLFSAALVAAGAFYTVDETKQVVVTRFGEPIGKPITEAGLYFKWPIAETANFFEKRLLRWDGDAEQIPTRDKRYIWVDTTARWRIVDALKFMQAVRFESEALSRLDDIIDGATRNVIASYNLTEIVRNNNRLVEEVIQKDENLDYQFEREALEKVVKGREALSREILEQSRKSLPKFGIELVDMRIKRVNYIEDVLLPMI